jgi:hypothetical protein
LKRRDITLKPFILCMLALVVISPVTLAQTRKRTAKKPVSTVPAKSATVRAGATQVANQVKNLTRYIYLLGGVAKGLEAADAAAARKEAPPQIIEQTNKNKDMVRATLRDIRAGLDKLETDFRGTPDLNRYYIRLAGSAAGAAAAEEQAAANQFDRAGRTLLDVLNRLTDVLVEMI